MATAATPTAASFATAASGPGTPSVNAPLSPPAGEEERIERWREDIDAREGSVLTAAGEGDGVSLTTTRTSSVVNPLRLEGSQSFMFWNQSQYEDRRGRPAAAGNEDATADDHPDERKNETRKEKHPEIHEEEEQRCPRCGGTSVREKEGRVWGFAKTKSLVCGECGLEKKG
jgi:hypothetical protein